MGKKNNLTGIILAGGKSSRMGENKALVLFQNRRMIDIAREKLINYTDILLVSSNKPIPEFEGQLVPDVVSEIGPIGGLYSCLQESATELNMVIPCDVPLLPASFYEQLLPHTTNYDVVIPRLPDGKLEPLIGFYKKSNLIVIEQMIATHDYKLIHLFDKVQTYYLDIQETYMFKNVNTPTDLL